MCELLRDVEGGGTGGGTLDTGRVAEATFQVLKEKRIWREKILGKESSFRF